MADAGTEKKFQILKKRLDALHYVQPFQPESASLVEKLLNDLIKTTEAFQNLKKNNEDIKGSTNKTELLLEPLKKENSRLNKENSELHFELIKVKEDAEFKENRLHNALKTLEGDRSDLKFVITQKDTFMKKMEDEMVALRHKLDLVYKKNYLSAQQGLENLPPNVKAPKDLDAKTTQGLPLRPQEFTELAEELKRTSSEEYQKWADNLRRADERAYQFQEQVKQVKEERGQLEEKLRLSELQINNRDKEIKRLQAKMEVSGSNLEKISVEHQINTSSEQISRLNTRLDFLTKENTGLEDQVKSLKSILSKSDGLRHENQVLNNQINDLKAKNEELRITVEKKDAVLDRFRGQKEKEQDSMLEVTNRQLDDKIREIKSLKERIDLLLAENKEFKERSGHANQTLSAYGADKKVFAENLSALNQEKNELASRLQEALDKLQRAERECHHNRDTISTLQGKISTLQREIDMLATRHTRTNDDYKEHHDAMNNLRQRINELEAENFSLNSRKGDLEAEIERGGRLRSHLEEQVEKLRSDTFKSRIDMDAGTHAHQRVQTLYESAVKDIEFLKREKQQLEAKMLDLKRNNVDIETKSNEYFELLNAERDQVSTLKKEIVILNDKLAQKLADFRTAQQRISDVERDFKIQQAENESLMSAQDRNSKFRKEFSELEASKLRVMTQIDELNHEVALLKTRNQEIEETNHILREQNNKLNNQITTLIADSETIDISLKRAKEREHDYRKSLDTLEEMKNREKHMIAENERLKAEIKKQENLILNGTRQVEHMNNQKDELLNEIKNLREEISILKMNDSEIKTKSIKLQEKLNNYDIMMADLRDEKSKVEAQLVKAEEELNTRRRELNSEKSQHHQALDQIKQLKTLCESLEKTKEELLIRIQNKGNERRAEDEEKTRLGDRFQQAQRRIEHLENEASESRNALVELDRERDNVQAQLDEKAEHFEKLRQRLNQQDDEMRALREKSSECLAVNDRQLSRVQELEGQIREFVKKNKSLIEENNQFRNVMGVKDVDIQKMANDLNILTRENQSISQKVMTVLAENDELKGHLHSTSNQEKMGRQALRATELEREDVLNNYRAVCIENERLKHNVDELTNDNQEFFKKIKDLENEMSYLKGHIQQQEIARSNLLNEISAYERNVSLLNKRLEQADSIIKESHAAKDKLLRDVHEIKAVTEGIEYSKDDLQRNLIAVEQDRAFMQDSLKQLQREYDMLHQRMDFEQRKYRDLEDILSQERKMQFQQSQSIEGLDREKIELQHNLHNAERKIHELQQRLSRDTELETFHTKGEQAHHGLFSEMQVTIQSLETKIYEQAKEITHLKHDQSSLRYDNSKLKSEVEKVESQRNDLEKHLKSLSHRSYDRDLDESASKQGSDGGWERLRMDSETFKKNLDDASLSSQYLRSRVQSLQSAYGESLHDRKHKK